MHHLSRWFQRDRYVDHVTALPTHLLEKIFSHLTYHEISYVRPTCQTFDYVSGRMLRRQFGRMCTEVGAMFEKFIRERSHLPIDRADIYLNFLYTELMLLRAVFGRHVVSGKADFYPGLVLDILEDFMTSLSQYNHNTDFGFKESLMWKYRRLVQCCEAAANHFETVIEPTIHPPTYVGAKVLDILSCSYEYQSERDAHTFGRKVCQLFPLERMTGVKGDIRDALRKLRCEVRENNRMELYDTRRSFKRSLHPSKHDLQHDCNVIMRKDVHYGCQVSSMGGTIEGFTESPSKTRTYVLSEQENRVENEPNNIESKRDLSPKKSSLQGGDADNSTQTKPSTYKSNLLNASVGHAISITGISDSFALIGQNTCCNLEDLPPAFKSNSEVDTCKQIIDLNTFEENRQGQTLSPLSISTDSNKNEFILPESFTFSDESLDVTCLIDEVIRHVDGTQDIGTNCEETNVSNIIKCDGDKTKREVSTTAILSQSVDSLVKGSVNYKEIDCFSLHRAYERNERGGKRSRVYDEHEYSSSKYIKGNTERIIAPACDDEI